MAIFGGTALIVCNPGYFWDDWVWLFQSPADSIRIGKELGVFWGGYLTNAINALAYPSLALRAVALITWLISGAAICFVLRRTNQISRREAVELFLIYAAAHIVPIRFLTSVALYNVYIAVFWCATALLIAGRRATGMRIASAVLFFLSFYLNSLILMYGLLIALMGLEAIRHAVTVPPRAMWKRDTIAPNLKAIWKQSLAPLRVFAKDHVLFLALPFIFVIAKRLTTAKSPLYNNYNDVNRRAIIGSIGDSFTLIRPVLRDWFSTSSRTVPPLALVIACIVCFLLLRLLPKRSGRTTWKTALMQLVLGLLIFASAIYPYIVVNKTPDLTSFYDARNIMPAVAGLVLVMVALANFIDYGFAYVPFLRRYGRDLLIGYVIGASVCAGFVSGLGLWHDWFRQVATMTWLSAQSDALRNVGTFVFNDSSSKGAYRGRALINYEYTGNLVYTFGGRSRLGISLHEYNTLPPRVQVLMDPYMMHRFNFGDWKIEKPHVIVSITDGQVPLTDERVLDLVGAYLQGENWRAELLHNYYHFDLANEFIETEQRVDEMNRIAKALAAYRLEHKLYPTVPEARSGSLPTLQIDASDHMSPPVVIGDIPDLFPQYLERPDSMHPRPLNQPNYLYISNGNDYKLVYANALDQAYAKQAHPALFDPVRGGYGVWTSDARYW
ncbi:hypothetical protein [Caballeronia sp. GAWG1-5s-s]|uniref:hypothetical protein n=1 Tax=Caballeronia sp. GAWG1-5s-s TaxID=2921743 RepID=UPI0020279351|nr:hypothetical protein [Caballeronia sp. GAWG1-5s-s]